MKLNKQTILSTIHEYYEKHDSLIRAYYSIDKNDLRDQESVDDIFNEYIVAYNVFIKQDSAKGIQLLMSSVEHGNDFAALTLAEVFRKGEIIPIDKRQSLFWLNKYAEMDTCLYVLDRLYPVVGEEYHSKWIGTARTIYDVTPNNIMNTNIQESFGWSDLGIQDLGIDDVGRQLFGRFFDMIKFTHRYEDKVKFRFDTGKVTTSYVGGKFESEYSDLDLVCNIKEMLKGLDAACDEMIPALEERDVHIRSIKETKELFIEREWDIEEEDL